MSETLPYPGRTLEKVWIVVQGAQSIEPPARTPVPQFSGALLTLPLSSPASRCNFRRGTGDWTRGSVCQALQEREGGESKLE